MDADAVNEILGEPTSTFITLAKWDGFAGSMRNQLRVYYADGHPVRITWMKVGYFVFERDLRPAKVLQRAVPPRGSLPTSATLVGCSNIWVFDGSNPPAGVEPNQQGVNQNRRQQL
jgi:hypothetical protein